MRLSRIVALAISMVGCTQDAKVEMTDAASDAAVVIPDMNMPESLDSGISSDAMVSDAMLSDAHMLDSMVCEMPCSMDSGHAPVDSSSDLIQ